jgi:predicted negative regulator of RcsB-dependent stress response
VALSAAEEESLEAIKRWWKESGRQLAAGIALVAVGYFGWQFWQDSQSRTAAEASAVYDRLTGVAVTAPGVVLEEQSMAQAQQLIQTLKSDHAGTVYALYGALFGAKLAVESDDLNTARLELEWLLANTRSGFFTKTDPTLVRLAQLRLAQVMVASGQYSEALELINRVDGQTLQADLDELRGDIFLAQGQRQQALIAYEAASAAGSTNPVLRMKISELQGSL